MTVETNPEEIVIRISAETNMEFLKKYLEYIRFVETASKSQATQEQIDELAEEINRSCWEKNKDKYLSVSK